MTPSDTLLISRVLGVLKATWARDVSLRTWMGRMSVSICSHQNSLDCVVFSIQREVTPGSRLQPRLGVQRRHQRVRGGRHHRPRHGHGGTRLHQAETQSKDEKN